MYTRRLNLALFSTLSAARRRKIIYRFRTQHAVVLFNALSLLRPSPVPALAGGFLRFTQARRYSEQCHRCLLYLYLYNTIISIAVMCIYYTYAYLSVTSCKMDKH